MLKARARSPRKANAVTEKSNLGGRREAVRAARAGPVRPQPRPVLPPRGPTHRRGWGRERARQRPAATRLGCSWGPRLTRPGATTGLETPRTAPPPEGPALSSRRHWWPQPTEGRGGAGRPVGFPRLSGPAGAPGAPGTARTWLVSGPCSSLFINSFRLRTQDLVSVAGFHG